MKNSRQNIFAIFSAALMITGTTIGIGILGLPIKTGIAGLLPSLIASVFVWGIMLGTGIIIAREIIHSGNRTADWSTIVQQKLGRAGKVLTVVGYLILIYGLLVAHLAAGGDVLSIMTGGKLSQGMGVLVFFLLSTAIALAGVDLVSKINSFLMAGLLIFFGVLIYEALKIMNPQYLTYVDWGYLPAAFPIIVCAMAYQLIIPSVCRRLNNEPKAVTKALFIGTLIPLFVNSLWIIVVIGALPLGGPGSNTILAAFKEGLPATIPLAAAMNSTTIKGVALIFSLIVLVASYVLQSTAILGFFQDLFPAGAEKRRWLTAVLLSFIPPLIVVFLYPGLFLKALDLIGGVSVILLFGLIPSLILWKDARGKGQRIVVATCLLIIFALLMGLEILQEAGFLRISPHVEYWFNDTSPR